MAQLIDGSAIAQQVKDSVAKRVVEMARDGRKVHLAAIYRTLGASSRLEALAKAHRAFASV